MGDSWTYKGESEGGPVTAVYKGTVSAAARIKFGVDGESTATQSK